MSVKQASSTDYHDGSDRAKSPYLEARRVKTDSLEYVTEQGGNGSLPTYQEATGAPIEVDSPLGLGVGWITIIFLNMNNMIGTGVFSTRKFRHSFCLGAST